MRASYLFFLTLSSAFVSRIYSSNSTTRFDLNLTSLNDCYDASYGSISAGVDEYDTVYLQYSNTTGFLNTTKLMGCLDEPRHISNILLVNGEGSMEGEMTHDLATDHVVLSGINQLMRVNSSSVPAFKPQPVEEGDNRLLGEVLLYEDSSVCEGDNIPSGCENDVCYNDWNNRYKSAQLLPYICSGSLEWTTWPHHNCQQGGSQVFIIYAGEPMCAKRRLISYRAVGNPC